jgi:hypothetical protein
MFWKNERDREEPDPNNQGETKNHLKTYFQNAKELNSIDKIQRESRKRILAHFQNLDILGNICMATIRIEAIDKEKAPPKKPWITQPA